MGATSENNQWKSGGNVVSRCLNPFYWLLSLLLFWPDLVFGAETEKTVKSSTDFGPLVDAAYVAGICSIAVAVIWASGLVLMARIKAGKGGDSKCG